MFWNVRVQQHNLYSFAWELDHFLIFSIVLCRASANFLHHNFRFEKIPWSNNFFTLKSCFEILPIKNSYNHSALLGVSGIVRTFISEFFKFRASYYKNFKQLLKEVIEGWKSCQNGTFRAGSCAIDFTQLGHKKCFGTK